MKNPILITEPNGEHAVKLVEKSCTGKGNSIFIITEKHGPGIILTGEELTSLSKQWMEYLTLEKVQSSKLLK